MSKAIVDLKEFQAAVKRVSAVLNKRSSFEILRNVIRFEVADGCFCITATDTDVTYHAFGDADSKGAWHEYLRPTQLEPLLRFKAKEHAKLVIETDSNDASIDITTPEFTLIRAGKVNSVDRSFLEKTFTQKVFDKEYKRMIQIRYTDDCKVFKDSLSCVSDDESRPAFTGVAYQTYNLISTNGSRLYKGMMSPINDNSFKGIMNTKLIKAIAGGLTGQLYERKLKSDGTTCHVLIADNGDVIISQSVSKDDDFPDFTKAIPTKWEGKMEINKYIYEIIKTYAAGFKNSCICFLENETTVRPLGKKEYTEERHFDRIDGMPVGFAVNTNYFLKAIELFKDYMKYDKTIKFCWVDCDSPLWVGKELSKVWGGGTGPDYLHGNGTVLMPMMI